MLKERVITAIVLLAIVLSGLFLLPPVPFAIFIAVAIGLAAWEWTDLSGVVSRQTRLGYVILILALMIPVWFMPASRVLLFGVIWWACALYLVLQYPRMTDIWCSSAARMLIGLLIFLPAWKGLVEMRISEIAVGDGGPGLWVILYVMVLVWGADTGAYFTGRAFGKRKLAPDVSPGKSWEGVYGGLATTTLIACIAAWCLGLTLPQGISLIVVTLLTVAASVVGDLSESMIKRYRGIKDSSNLLPGHGGVMDRIDSLTAAAPVFGFCALSLGWFG